MAVNDIAESSGNCHQEEVVIKNASIEHDITVTFMDLLDDDRFEIFFGVDDNLGKNANIQDDIMGDNENVNEGLGEDEEVHEDNEEVHEYNDEVHEDNEDVNEEGDSDFEGGDNCIDDVEVDMRDFRMNIDLDVENINNQSNEADEEIEQEVLNNEILDSGSDSDVNESTVRKNMLREKDSETWMVKTLVDEHKCLQSRSIKHCTSSFLCKQLMEQIEENPTIPTKAVQDQFQRKLEVEVSRMKAFRAKTKALTQLHGDYNSQYGILRDYVCELWNTNPGTTVKIEVEPSTDPSSNTRRFKRIYVCLGSLKQGFKKIGRDLLGLDGAFMKGPFPGQILTAVGIDPNNGIYPLSYAIVEAENLSSWTWFLNCLGDDLELDANSNFTFISDRQKGIIPALAKVFPCAEHRYCLRHIHENMKHHFRGKAYKDMLWKLATSTTVSDFEILMDELKRFNSEAQLWLSKIPPKHWSRSHFSSMAHSDVLLNNMCEVMNAKILDGRDKPIITVLEFIREYLMRRIVNVLRVIDRSDGLLTPTATKMFESIKKEATKYTVQWNGEEHYQVSGPKGEQCLVDLNRKICVCRRWEITGMPCKHAVAAIWNKANSGKQIGIPENFVDPIYRLERWKEVYNFKVYPINGRSLWPKSLVPTIITPPTHHKPVGRPKKVRKKSAFELDDAIRGGRLSKKGTTVTCVKCKKKGHNSRTCKGQEQV
ncbi:hypothetical protein L1987_25455 [Smallanthus sonchifolius]|uniref:Uncharacterized protein n=1 Tax=Smallanthus sonchifolius TaxID=185202 RepID=A0ACB9INF6_9ASTR|nr:hypothetical protein L1987_25455 [Smallanthus sonchifolius]